MRQSRVKKLCRIIGITLLSMAVIIIINFMPTFNLRTAHMSVLSGEYVEVYYEAEEAAAKDVFEFAKERAIGLCEALGVTTDDKVKIYIYDDQKTMQQKKYGFIASFLKLDWYIGDNIGTDIILTSPANPGPIHDYDNNKNAVLHEMVHAYNSIINPKMSYWYDNGLAGYLSNQAPNYPICSYVKVPTIKQMNSNNILTPIIFANYGGYEYSYTYIEYLEKTYGWDTVVRFAYDVDFEGFGASEQEIYEQWMIYLKTYYSE